MDITGPVQRVIDHLIAHRREKHEHVAAYLDSIAAHANRLAQAWEQILALQPPDGTSGLPDSPPEQFLKFDERARHLLFPQQRLFFKMELLYRTIAEAISGEVNDRFRDHLINVLRSLLSERIVARHEVETMLRQRQPVLFFGRADANVRTLEQAVQGIQREATALEVLALRFRLKGSLGPHR